MEVSDLKEELLLLRKENKELRDEIRLNPLECALSEAQVFRGQVAALQAENANLSELAKLMHKTIGALQDTLDASFVYNGVELSAEYFETELNKLGIEVEYGKETKDGMEA